MNDGKGDRVTYVQRRRSTEKKKNIIQLNYIFVSVRGGISSEICRFCGNQGRTLPTLGQNLPSRQGSVMIMSMGCEA